MTVEELDPRHRLLRLLVERPDYAEAYHNDAEFHAYVDGIITIMPLLLATAYKQTYEHRKSRERELEKIMMAPIDKRTKTLLGEHAPPWHHG
jgi:hypothetical protein